MSNLLTLQFWFNQRPDLLIPAMEKLLLGLIIFFIIASIVFFILQKRKGFYGPLWKKLLSFCVSSAVIGVLLNFFSEELVPFLSARIWFAFWAVGMIIWAVFIIIYARQLPSKKRQFAQEKEFKKYLP